MKNTANLMVEYIDLRQQLRLVEINPTSVEIKYPAEVFEDTDLNKISFEAIGATAKQHDVVVKQIGAPLWSPEDGFFVLTEEITLEGDFISMLRCIDDADETLGFIKISSLKFEREEGPRGNSLNLKVYLQTIKSQDHAVE